MKRPWFVYTILGVLFYLVFLIIGAPASLLALAIHRASHGTVSLQQVSGSVWSGRGELVFQRSYGSAYRFGAGTWGVNPLWIVTGRIGAVAQFAGDDGKIAMRMRIGAHQIIFEGIELRLAAPALPAIYAPSALVDPGGLVTVSAQNFEIGTKHTSGEAEIRWLDAQSNLSTVKPLGDYRLQLTGKGDVLAVKLETLKGVLNLSGSGRWGVNDQRLEFRGEARPTAQQTELEPMLRLFGRDLNGRRELLLNLKIP